MLNRLPRLVLLVAAVFVAGSMLLTGTASAEPTIKAQLKLNDTVVEQNDPIAGTVTITLSGFSKAVTLLAVAQLFQNEWTSEPRYRSFPVMLENKGNGRYTLALSKDFGLSAQNVSDEAYVSVFVSAMTGGKNAPYVDVRAKIDVKPAAEKIELLDDTPAYLKVAVGRLVVNQEHICSLPYLVENNGDKAATVSIHQTMGVTGAVHGSDIFPDITKDISIPGVAGSDKQNPQLKLKFTKPGLYTIWLHATCQGAKPLDIRAAIQVVSAENAKNFLEFNGISADAATVEAGQPIRFTVDFSCPHMLGVNLSVKEHVSILGPDGNQGAFYRMLSRLPGTQKSLYQVRVTKLGQYTFKDALYADNAWTPAPITAKFTVTQQKSGTAGKTVWVCSKSEDSGNHPHMQVSGTTLTASGTYGPGSGWSGKSFSNTLSWSEPPLTVTEGQLMKLDLHCTSVNEPIASIGAQWTAALGQWNGFDQVGNIGGVGTGSSDLRDFSGQRYFSPMDNPSVQPYVELRVNGPGVDFFGRRWTYEKRSVTQGALEGPIQKELSDITPKP